MQVWMCLKFQPNQSYARWSNQQQYGVTNDAIWRRRVLTSSRPMRWLADVTWPHSLRCFCRGDENSNVGRRTKEKGRPQTCGGKQRDVSSSSSFMKARGGFLWFIGVVIMVCSIWLLSVYRGFWVLNCLEKQFSGTKKYFQLTQNWNP